MSPQAPPSQAPPIGSMSRLITTGANTDSFLFDGVSQSGQRASSFIRVMGRSSSKSVLQLGQRYSYTGMIHLSSYLCFPVLYLDSGAARNPQRPTTEVLA